MQRIRKSSLRLAAFGAIASLSLASTFAQTGDAPNGGGPQQGMNGRGPGMGGRGPGMRGGGPAAIVVSETFGATVRPLPRNQAEASAVKPGVGLVVEGVKDDSPAAKAGLKEGDILIKLGDQWVINPAQLGTLLSIQDVDAAVKLTLKRGSESVDVDLKFDQAAHDAMAKAIDSAPTGGGMRGGPGGGPGGGGRGGPDGGDRPAPPDGGGMNP